MNRLRLEVGPGTGPMGVDLRVLVDGRESLWGGGDDKFGADQVLGSGALHPQDPPRRVALYTCGCHCPGCDNVSMLVARDGDVVRWSSFMSVVGEYEGPLPAVDDPDPYVDDEDADVFRQPIDLPDLDFDAGEYLAEVEAATDDLDRLLTPPSSP